MRRRSRVLINALIFVLVLSAAISGAGIAGAQVLPACPEGGDGSGAPATFGASTPCEGAMSAGEPADWFAITLNRGQRLVISSTTTAGPTPFSYGFQVLNPAPNDAPVGGCLDNNLAADACTFLASESGAYRFGVIRNAGQANGAYALAVSATPAQNDCAEGEDIGETVGTAFPVTALNAIAAVCTGELGLEDPIDVYAVPGIVTGMNLTATTAIPAVATDAPFVGPKVEILDPNGNVQASSGLLGGAAVEADGSGTWYVRVSGQPTPYKVTINAIDADCPEDQGEADAGNTFDEATPLDPQPGPQHVTFTATCAAGAQIHPAGDPQDWWRLPIRRNTHVLVSLDGPAGMAMRLYDAGNNLRASASAGTPISLRSLSAHDNTDDWRVVVEKTAGNGASYKLPVTLSDRDCQSHGDAQQTTADALDLPADVADPDLNDVCGAALWQLNDVDLYKLQNVVVTDLVEVRLSWADPAKDFDLALVQPDGTEIPVPEGTGVEQVVQEAAAAGDWFIKVFSSAGHTGRYDLDVALVTNDDCALGGDAGDTQATASMVATIPPTECNGALPHQADVNDWYAFDVSTAVSQVSVVMAPRGDAPTTSPPNGDYDLEVIDALGNVHRSETAGAGVPERVIVVKPFGAGGDGTWYARIKYRTGARGTYTMAISQVTV